MKAPQEAYLAAVNNLASLNEAGKRTNLEAQRITTRNKERVVEIDELSKNLTATRIKCAGGLASDADLSSISQQLNQVKIDLDADKETLKAIEQGKRGHDTAVAEAKRKVESALSAAVEALAKPIRKRLGNDAKLRQELLELYAIFIAETDQKFGAPCGCSVEWESVLLSVFIEPDPDEISTVYEKATRRLTACA